MLSPGLVDYSICHYCHVCVDPPVWHQRHSHWTDIDYVTHNCMYRSSFAWWQCFSQAPGTPWQPHAGIQIIPPPLHLTTQPMLCVFPISLHYTTCMQPPHYHVPNLNHLDSHLSAFLAAHCIYIVTHTHIHLSKYHVGVTKERK